MNRLLIFIGMTIFGWVGWWIGAKVGFGISFMLSGIGSIVGVYVGWRINRDYLSGYPYELSQPMGNSRQIRQWHSGKEVKLHDERRAERLKHRAVRRLGAKNHDLLTLAKGALDKKLLV